MKVVKAVTPVLIVASLFVLVYGCSSKEEGSTTTKTLTATVQRGDISLEVTGTGNLAFSETEDLVFDIAGTVEEVLVTAGESVTEEQELARLDTSVWEDQITLLQKGLITAQRTLVTTERAVSSKKLALRQAELDLQSAENDLDDITVVKYAQDVVDNIESALETIQTNYTTNPTFWAPQLEELTKQLALAKSYLNEVLSGTNLGISGDVTLQIAKKVLALDQSKMQLENAQLAVEDAIAAVNDAEVTVEEARSDLDESQGLSPIITAPFAGFITKVNINGGNEVQKGTIALQLANPNKFKANIQVTEEDIFSIKLGSSATVIIDATEMNYPATITAIAPTATVSSGVVSYKVTVELDTARRTGTGGTLPSGMTPPPGFSGNITMPSGTIPPTGISGNMTVPSGVFPFTSDISADTTTSMSLRDGLTATVTITVTQASDVLIIPSKALIRSGRTYTVQVINGTTTETRTVTIGESDDSNTEITSGLVEGEMVTYTVSSSSSTNSIGNFGFQEFRDGMGGGVPIPGGF